VSDAPDEQATLARVAPAGATAGAIDGFLGLTGHEPAGGTADG
jgi:hypothetical protein